MIDTDLSVVARDDTLATNIVLGRPFDRARLRRAAILTFIESLETGFEAVLVERGLKLFGGERQRFAIAHALSTPIRP